jgi:hypothetical protein
MHNFQCNANIPPLDITQRETIYLAAYHRSANLSRPLLGGSQRSVVEQSPLACGIVLEKPILFWPRLSEFSRFVYGEFDAISVVP